MVTLERLNDERNFLNAQFLISLEMWPISFGNIQKTIGEYDIIN